jgi:GxxExxY protein
LVLVVKNQYVESGHTGDIIGAAMEAHKRLGPGFIESVYEEALVVELKLNNIKFERQKELPVIYRDNVIKKFICDFLVEGKVIVEIKAIKTLGEIEKVQLTSYLKASGIEVGLPLNFGGESLEIKRMIYSKNKSVKSA